MTRAGWLTFISLAAVIVFTRAPLYPQQILSFDDINFAYAIGEFDIRISQPQPPGYPLFVAETRIMHHLFRVKRPESNFLLLSVLGSIAVMWLTMRAGDRMLASGTGLCAGLLLLLHPTFWYTGLTSPIRIQLGVVTLVVGLACWRVWNGDAAMLKWSALALGLGAGVRPELGPMLFPLWVACALRAPASWRDRSMAAGVLAASIAVWLIPAALASGGFERYFTHCWLYMKGQSQQVKAGVFGSDGSHWLQSMGWLGAWALQDLVWWPMFAPVAWRSKVGFGFGPSRLRFFALWLVPMLLFAGVVHVADPGHVMNILPVICLLGGHLIIRASERMAGFPGASIAIFSAAWVGAALFLVLRVIDWRVFWRDSDWVLALIWLGVCVGVLLSINTHTHARSWTERQAAMAFLTPVLLIHYWAFFHPDFSYRMRSYAGWQGVLEKARSYAQDALHMSRAQAVWQVANTDDGVLQSTAKLAAEKPGKTWLVWLSGESPWRKAAYYFPNLPILVLTKRTSDGAPVFQFVRGRKMERQLMVHDIAAELPAGSRLVVWSDHRTPEFKEVAGALPLRQEGPVYLTDLPSSPGQFNIGAYLIRWR